MRILRRVLEYVWYPVFLTVCFWISVQVGVFDPPDGMARLGGLILAFMLWRLCSFILSAPYRSQQIYLILAFCWYIGAAANSVFDPTPRAREQINREVWIACLPLILGIKYIQINRDLQRD